MRVCVSAEHTFRLDERMQGTKSLRAFMQTNIPCKTILLVLSQTNFCMCQSVQVNFALAVFFFFFLLHRRHTIPGHMHASAICAKPKRVKKNNQPNSHSNLEFIAFSESRCAHTMMIPMMRAAVWCLRDFPTAKMLTSDCVEYKW